MKYLVRLLREQTAELTVEAGSEEEAREKVNLFPLHIRWWTRDESVESVEIMRDD